LRRVIEASPVMPAQVVLISFEDDILSEAKRALPDCDALFLADVPEEAAEDKMSSLIQFCRTRRFDGLGVSADWPIDAQLMERLRAENLQLNVWTVNDAHRAGELLAAGVTSITTDRPAWLREQLSGGR